MSLLLSVCNQSKAVGSGCVGRPYREEIWRMVCQIGACLLLQCKRNSRWGKMPKDPMLTPPASYRGAGNQCREILAPAARLSH